MNIKIIILFSFLFFFLLKINAQTVKKRDLKQAITYHTNGNVQYIKNFILGDCYNDQIKIDTCYYGIFKEYYANGNLKTSGQYDCRFWNKNYKGQDTINYIPNDCFQTGYWNEFDSLGNFQRAILYNEGAEIFYKYPFKSDTLFAQKDSLMLKMKGYSEVNSYFIKRSKKNKKLLLEFPILGGLNYWGVYDKPIEAIIQKDQYGENYYYSLKGYGNYIMGIKYDDIPGNQRYLDFSNLKNGTYYVYYRSYREIYEAEVIIQNIDD